MTETEFIELIDCRLPYQDADSCRALSELGARISANSAFMVLHEICRPPRSVSVSAQARAELLAIWREEFNHPLIQNLLPAAKAMIDGEGVPVDEALALMRVVAQHDGQFNALAIPYFACDDVEGEADALHNEIIRDWARGG